MNTPAPTPPAPVARAGLAGWMFFDWAAQPFFTAIITFIFGPYFVSRLAGDPAAGQAWWGYTITVGGVVIALLSPVLGSIADAAGPRKPWIFAFAVLQIAAMALLWFAAPGTWLLYPAVLIVCASLAAEFSIVFNDSMLPRLAGSRDLGRISNIAWGLGYVGGMIFLIFVIAFLAGDEKTGKTLLGLQPLFGLDPAAGEGARATGPLAALWYAVFVLPMFLFTPDTTRAMPIAPAIRAGLAELAGTLRKARSRPGILRFLAARMIYQDGVNGLLALGGTFAAAMFSWSTVEIGIYGILLNVVAIGGCVLAARLDFRLGSKTVVLLSLACLIVATVGIVSTGPGYTLFGLLSFAHSAGEGLFATPAEKAYIVFGLLVGVAFGPVQASSRSYLARNIDPAEAGQFFGLYALAGRATSFLAPFAVATVTLWTGSARAGMATLVAFLAIGALVLFTTREPAATATAG